MNLEVLSREELIALLRAQRADSYEPSPSEEPWHDLKLQVGELELRNRMLLEQQRELEAAKRRYSELYDFAPVAIFTVGLDARIEDVNLTAAAFFGGTRDQLVGRPLTALVVADERARVRAQLKRCVSERARATSEVRLLLEGIGTAPFQLVTTALIDGERVTGCKCALTDVSALKRSEERLQALARASAQLASSFDVNVNVAEIVRMLVPAFGDLIFFDVVDSQQNVTRVEVGCADPSKRGVAEALKRPVVPFVELSEPLMVTTASRAALALALAETPDRPSIVESCDPRAVMLVPVTARDRAVGLLGFIMAESRRSYGPADLEFANDLASRMAMAIDNARLFNDAQRAIRVREDVLSIVSHDLKSPLSGIRLNADLMMAAAPPSERRKGRVQLERIKFAVSHMERLIDDLLDMGSIDNGRLAVVPKDQCLRTLMHDAVELLGPLAQEHEMKLEALPPSEDIWVGCDRGRVLQVFSNLVGNAIKFCPKDTTISVSAQVVEGKARVTVKDDGPGMPASVLRNLFQRFFQAKETASKGRGLGLFISKGIIQSLGGEIWVESAPGRGTAVSFTLPIVSAPRPPVVLVVEDDQPLRETLRELLVAHGYGVAVAGDGGEALTYLRNGGEPPKLILLDLGLPGVDGREVMRQLKADPVLAKIPVVLVSSADRLEDEVKQLGADGMVKKPLDFKSLLSTVDVRTHARA